MEFINTFDSNLLDVGVSFLAVACKYAAFFGIMGFLCKRIVGAFSGKERIF